MKFKKLLGGGLLATVLALGVGAGLAVRSESKAESVNASDSVSGSILLESPDYWGNANCKIALYFYEGEKGTSSPSNTGWSDLVYLKSSYKETIVTYSLSFTPNYMIAVRYNPDFNETDWKTDPWGANPSSYGWDASPKWNQSQDIPFVDDGSITMTGWDWGTPYSIYYVTGSSTPTDNYIYTFDVKWEKGGWPGTKVTSVHDVYEMHKVLKFQGTDQLIYKIPIDNYDNPDTKVILHDNNGTQTGDMPLGRYYAYWYGQGYQFGSENAGKALNFLRKVEFYRNNVVADGEDILDYSICGIDPKVAGSLWNEYYGFDKDIKDMIDGTTAYTYEGKYDGKTIPGSNDIPYSSIMTQLRDLAAANNVSVSGRITGVLFGGADNSTPIMLVVIISVVSLTAVGGYIFLKRRKEN